MSLSRHLSFAFGSLLACLLGAKAASPNPREWHSEAGFRWSELSVAKDGKTGFTLLTPEQTGIYFTNAINEWKGESNRVLTAGSGVAVGDFDHDGRPDLFFCSLEGRNTLYKNLGDWKFQDVTAAAGLGQKIENSRGAVFADVNGDDSLDLLVAATGLGVLCFTNDGHGKFSASGAFSTTNNFASVTLALADVDGNGTLDLYVCNYRTEDIRDRGQVDLHMVRGQLVIPPAFKDRLLVADGQVIEYGDADALYLNDGHGHFTPVSWTDGTFLDEDGKPLTRAPLDWGLTATFRDMNGDGFPDLYVCNDYWTPDRIWMNDGHGHFRALNKLALRRTSSSSMGVDFADLNRSGNMDFLVVDMLSRDHRLRKRQTLAQRPVASVIGINDDRPQTMRNTLLQNRGDGTFAEIADLAGLSASEWAWQPIFLDVDLDGYEDVLIATGHFKDVQDLDAGALIRSQPHPRPKGNGMVEYQGKMMSAHEAFITEKILNSRYYPRLDTPIVAFQNRGQYRFQETTTDWGLGAAGVHHGMALADLDGDGTLDVVVNNLGTPAGIYRNNSPAPRVAVRLKGRDGNTQGIGAKIKFLGGAVPMQSQEVVSGGRYLSGSEPLLVFAAGKSSGDMSIQVTWRSGRVSSLSKVGANRLYEIDEPATGEARVPVAAAPAPLFKDVSALLNHTHVEPNFDDFALQALLPFKLSQFGPGVAWFDLDGDGHEELILGNGRGAGPAFWHTDGKGGLARMEAPAELTLPDDSTGLAGWATARGDRSLLMGVASYEATGHAAVMQVGVLNGGVRARSLIPEIASSAGPVAVADFDGDGDLDVFVGGRMVAGKFPEAASSRLFRQSPEGLQLDEENSRLLENVGLVSGAVWSDLDGDGFPELLLACQWGPLKIFRNDHGKLTPWDAPLTGAALSPQSKTLSHLTGWWNSVTTADVDGDGRLDIIAGNWGLNLLWQASAEDPAEIFYGNIGGAGAVDIIEAETDPVTGNVVPVRTLTSLATSMPYLRGVFANHKAYSEATVHEVLGAPHERAQRLKAVTLASMCFLNRGDHFEAMELPFEAQVAPVFSINVADVDNDGNEDLFLSQNFFATRAEVPRLDAGRGLWLRGDGRGGWHAMPGQESGVKIYGEQRGAALGDFNEDGRVDLVVSQNGAATKLYQNMTARAGLRVRVVGTAGNPDGTGVILRPMRGGKAGAARELHAGSGYWSQDGAVTVFGGTSRPEKFEVIWPGGKKSSVTVPPDVKELKIKAVTK